MYRSDRQKNNSGLTQARTKVGVIPYGFATQATGSKLPLPKNKDLSYILRESYNLNSLGIEVVA